MAKRIFIEAKPTAGVTSWAHTYFVLREEGAERGSPADQNSSWIGGHPVSGIDDGNIQTAEAQFGPGKDWIYGDTLPIALIC